MSDSTDQTDFGDPFATDSQPPDVIASTGSNDSNNFWGGLLQSALTQTVSTGIPIAGQALRQQLNLQTPQATPAASGGPTAQVSGGGGGISASLGLGHSGPSNTMIYVIGGALVLVLGWMLMRGK